MRLGLLLAVFAGVLWRSHGAAWWSCVRYEPREGDIVFQSLPRSDLVRAIEGCTHSPLSHCGIVVRSGDGWSVLESIGHVRATPLYRWIRRGRGGRLGVRRLVPAERAAIPAFVAAARRYEGRPYDFRYHPDDGAIYCSELVWKAWHDATGGALGAWVRLGDLDWRPYEETIRAFENGAPPPLEREMITPADLAAAEGLEPVPGFE